ncbi:hypothetical protein [Streptomyces sp. NPDC102462]|uniref:hypothetical protein n=1 Tax=Streptomyces sp. NPDC102462 TaxID=3366178 RepID=UPI003827DA37
MQELERITGRWSEPDMLAGELAEQDTAAAEAAAAVAPTPARVAGRAVLLIPHRSENPDEAAPPADCRRILAIVRAADGPVQVRPVGEEPGLQVTARGKLEPLRGDGRFSALLEQ